MIAGPPRGALIGWLAATAALVAGCGSGGRAGPPLALAQPAGQTHLVTLDKRNLPLLADAVREPDGVAVVGGQTLVVHPALGSALLAFDVSHLDIGCVGTAVLRVPAVEVDMPVLAYVSMKTDIATTADGTNLGPNAVAPNSPSQAETSGPAASTLTFDAAPLLAWNHQHQPAATVFVAALRPQFPPGGVAPAAFGASESGRPATLSVTERPECSKSG